MTALTKKNDRQPSGGRAKAAIYPNDQVWPENILRFHIVFDEPMDMDGALHFVRLETENGAPVSGAIVDLIDGLWTADQRVLTVLFHPGRVKTGLASNQLMGRALQKGCRYRISVSGAMPDATGKPLGDAIIFPFVVGAPEVQAIDPSTWAWRSLCVGSRAPLRIKAKEALDFLGLIQTLRVRDRFGEVPLAHIVLDGRDVLICPVKPWRDVSIDISLDTRLEDVCGNRCGRAFEERLPAVEPDDLSKKIV